MDDRGISPRLATPADAAAIVATLSGAFDADPIWSWAFPDDEKRPAQYEAFFGLFVESALPNGWVWTTDQATAVAVWTPPGKSELSDEAKARVEPFVTAELGAHAEPVLQVFESFESACPDDADFYYLSLLGTHPDHRGRGLGMSLLAANLTQIDAEGMPAYLESSNPANNARYERLGFRPRTKFSTPEGRHTVTTMWREPLNEWNNWWETDGRRELRALLMTHWDPIGVKGIPQAHTEYDMYLDDLANLLRDGADADRVIGYLADIVEKQMALPTNRDQLFDVANRTIDWYATEVQR